MAGTASYQGLLCSLLGIERPGQLATHPLRGALFENWVVAEVSRQFRHSARRPHLSFYRERGRLEIDLLVEQGADLTAIEVKAGQTPSSRYFEGFDTLAGRLESRGDQRWRLSERLVVFGGATSERRSAGELLGWSDLQSHFSG